jgi:hypothetical protein
VTAHLSCMLDMAVSAQVCELIGQAVLNVERLGMHDPVVVTAHSPMHA